MFSGSWFGSSHGSLKNGQTRSSVVVVRTLLKQEIGVHTKKGKNLQYKPSGMISQSFHPSLCKIGALESGFGVEQGKAGLCRLRQYRGWYMQRGEGRGGGEQLEGTSSVPIKLYTSLPPFPLSLSRHLSSIPYCILTPSSSSPPLSACVHLTASRGRAPTV